MNEGDWGEDFGDATAFAPPAPSPSACARATTS